jgi:peroxiredoxin
MLKFKKGEFEMKRISVLLSAVFVLVAVFSFSASSAAKNDFTVGTTIENFKLPDINGKEQSFNDLKGKNGAIIVFLSIQCPVVRGYNERIIKLAEDYKALGVNVIGINSNATESLEEVKKHAEENYKFPVLIDKGNVLADKFNATATPEMFFFDEKNTLLYHGAIDDDRSGKNVSVNFLRTALDENLADKPITKAETKAFGCTIKRVGM